MPDDGVPPHLWLNARTDDEARGALARCCGSRRWVARMLERRPFATEDDLRAAASAAWAALGPGDLREAFGHHPPIGGDLDGLRRRFATTADWSREEQAGVAAAGQATLLALQAANEAYRQRFGYVFIVCATGMTAAQMLDALRARLDNDPGPELAVAAAELAKITDLRLGKLGR